MNLTDLLKTAVERGASDLHLTVGIAPLLRIDGLLQPLDLPVLEDKEMEKMALELLGKEKWPLLESNGEGDLSNQCPGVGSFRVNLYRQRGSIGAAFQGD